MIYRIGILWNISQINFSCFFFFLFLIWSRNASRDGTWRNRDKPSLGCTLAPIKLTWASYFYRNLEIRINEVNDHCQILLIADQNACVPLVPDHVGALPTIWLWVQVLSKICEIDILWDRVAIKINHLQTYPLKMNCFFVALTLEGYFITSTNPKYMTPYTLHHIAPLCGDSTSFAISYSVGYMVIWALI